MREGIHPKYVETKVSCGCGASFTTRSTVPELKVDICNECHPFYTGKLKYVDTAGRIEKFKSKFAGGYSSLKRGKKGKAAEAQPAEAQPAEPQAAEESSEQPAEAASGES